MIVLAVEQFQANDDAVVFGDLLHPVQAGDGIARAFFVRHAAAVSREGNDVGNSGLCGQRDISAKGRLDGRVVLGPVECVGNIAPAGVGHGADESVAAREFVLLGLEQIDSFQADLSRERRELIKRDFLVAPAADRLMKVILPDYLGLFRVEGGCQWCQCRCAEARLQSLATAESYLIHVSFPIRSGLRYCALSLYY